jgi:diguanylate cyclase (GGDEF)-like protein
LIDLDYFKQVNDVHGHAIGDDVLQRVVEACRDHLRSTDIFGRLGGEEFGILFPECALGQVIARAEQLRLAIVSVSDDIAADILISASFGVATTTRSGYALQQLLLHVDDALYRSKREGRNRVSVADASQPTLRMV